MPEFIETGIKDDNDGYKILDEEFKGSRKVHPDARNRLSQNAIMIACKKGAAEWLGKFLENVVEDVNIFDAIDSTGKSALHYASENGCHEAVELLCQTGERKNEEQTRILKRVNLSDEKGLVPLHLASANGRIEVVKYLCDRGANLEAQD